MFRIKDRKIIPCKTCEKPTPMLGTKLCDPCWEIETRLSRYLNNENAIQFVSAALYKVGRKLIQATPPDPQHGHESEKVKPLAQYLAVVSDMERPKTQAFFQQALDAYESTENVTIKIERV